MRPRALTEVQSQRLRQYLTAANSPDTLPESPTVKQLVENTGVNATLLDALDVYPAALVGSGAALTDLIALDYSARHLVRDAGFAALLVRKYGKAPVAAASLRTTEDAVTLSGTRASVTLGLTPKLLLNACGGDRAAGELVISRLINVYNAATRARAVEVERAAKAAANAGAPLDPLAQLRAKLPPSAGVLAGVPVETLARLGITALVNKQRYTHLTYLN